MSTKNVAPHRPFLLICLLLLSFGAHSLAFDFEDVVKIAKKKAETKTLPEAPPLPPVLSSLTYDQYRAIRFRPEKSWWAGEDIPFRLQFFHMGNLFHMPVHIYELIDGKPKEIRFSPSLFRYDFNDGKPLDLPADTTFSGFRIHRPWPDKTAWDEFAVFLGSSYFRMIGEGMNYGLSARGLALDTAVNKKEEFPLFSNFWIKRPQPKDASITVYALLESASVMGAYEFQITPASETVADVKAKLFIRQSVRRFGIAPLTSMYWYGENSKIKTGDYRPEVHDSDAFVADTSDGLHIWMPLQAVDGATVVAIPDENPRGFGLWQRDRDFNNYQDLESVYQLRPNLFVQPKGNWGKGSYQVVELPTDKETNDNIVAFWVPAVNPKPGDVLDLAYTLYWKSTDRTDLAKVMATRIEVMQTVEQQRFIIDWALAPNQTGFSLSPEFKASGGAEISRITWERNPFNAQWRASALITRKTSENMVDLECFLKDSTGHIVSEVWKYQWNP